MTCSVDWLMFVYFDDYTIVWGIVIQWSSWFIDCIDDLIGWSCRCFIARCLIPLYEQTFTIPIKLITGQNHLIKTNCVVYSFVWKIIMHRLYFFLQIWKRGSVFQTLIHFLSPSRLQHVIKCILVNHKLDETHNIQEVS